MDPCWLWPCLLECWSLLEVWSLFECWSWCCFAAVRKFRGWESVGVSPMEGSRFRSNPWPGRADAGVLKALRCEGRSTAVEGSPKPPGDNADSAIGVAAAAMGVMPSSCPPRKNLSFVFEPPN